MKKLGILLLTSWAFCFLLPQQGDADMSALTEGEMEEQYFKTWNLHLAADLTNKGDEKTGSVDLSEQTEEDKFDEHTRDKSNSEILAPEPEPKIDQLESYERFDPSGNIAIRSGRTLIIENSESYSETRPSPPLEVLNPNTP